MCWCHFLLTITICIVLIFTILLAFIAFRIGVCVLFYPWLTTESWLVIKCVLPRLVEGYLVMLQGLVITCITKTGWRISSNATRISCDIYNLQVLTTIEQQLFLLQIVLFLGNRAMTFVNFVLHLNFDLLPH